MTLNSSIAELKRKVSTLENHLENLRSEFHVDRFHAYTMLANEFRDLELDATEIDIKIFEDIAEKLEKQSKDIDELKATVNKLLRKIPKAKRK